MYKKLIPALLSFALISCSCGSFDKEEKSSQIKMTTETREYTYDEAVKAFDGNQQALDFIERERKRQ
jgi:hypothetical protein